MTVSASRVIGFLIMVAVVQLTLTGEGWAKDPKALWREECSACHDPFPPSLLPAYSWKKIMDNLGDHFGTNAEIEEPDRGTITKFLVAGRSTKIPMRITEEIWFRSIHGGLETMAAQKNAKIINCSACHRL